MAVTDSSLGSGKRPAINTMPKSQPIERQAIRKYVAKTALGMLLAYIALYFFIPIPVPPLPRMIDRLVYTLRLQSFSCLTLIGGIMNVSWIRLRTTAIDPINGRGDHHVAVETRYISNTVEQLMVSVSGQMILTTYLHESQFKVIPILVMFFVFGRIAFYYGYKQSYLKRAIGFSATFGVNMILWLVIMFYVISGIFAPSKT